MNSTVTSYATRLEGKVLEVWERGVILGINGDKARVYLRQKVKVHGTQQITQYQVSLESPSSSVRTSNGGVTYRHMLVASAAGPVTWEGWQSSGGGRRTGISSSSPLDHYCLCWCRQATIFPGTAQHTPSCLTFNPPGHIFKLSYTHAHTHTPSLYNLY